MWLITNIIKDAEFPFKQIFKNEELALYGDVEFIYSNNSGTHNYSFGYLLNTLNSPDSIKSLTSKKDYGALSKENPDYRKYLKGNFTLVSVGKDWFTVDGDRFGVQKWFYWNDGKQFIVSDSLSAIRQMVNPQISPLSMAMYALLYHFTAGLTLFEGIKHNEPAQFIEYKKATFKIDTYWDPLSLLQEQDQDVNIQDICNVTTKIANCAAKTANCRILMHRRTSLTRPFLAFVTGNLQFRSPKIANCDTINANAKEQVLTNKCLRHEYMISCMQTY